MKKTACFIFFLLCFLKNAYSLTIEISNPNLRPFKIYVSETTIKSYEMIGVLVKNFKLMPNIAFTDVPDFADFIINVDKTSNNPVITLTSQKTGEISTFEIKHSEDLYETSYKLGDLIFEKMTQTNGIFDTKFVFSMNWHGTRQIFMSDLTGKKLKKITDNINDSVAPKLSPDRKFIVYTRYFRTGGTSLRLINLNTLEDIPVYSSKDLNMAGSFSEDSSEIYFTSYDGRLSKIFSYNVKSKDISLLYASRARLVSPVKTFNKDRIAFVSDELGGPQIFLFDLKKKSTKRITYKHSYSTSPSFTTHGTHFVYVAQVNGLNKLFISSIDGTDFAALTPMDKNFENPFWTKNERFLIALSSDSSTSTVFLIDIPTLKFDKLFTVPALISYFGAE